MRTRAIVSTLVTLGWLVACSGSAERTRPSSGDPPGDEPEDVGTPVQLELKTSAAAELEAEVATAKQHDAASLLASYPVSFSGELGYSLEGVQNLDLIQGSELRLSDAELEKLGLNGFVVSSRLAYPSFPYAYAAIYVHDLPVFVSGDMVLEALHRSYDDILQAVEQEALIPRVSRLLVAMREARGIQASCSTAVSIAWLVTRLEEPRGAGWKSGRSIWRRRGAGLLETTKPFERSASRRARDRGSGTFSAAQPPAQGPKRAGVDLSPSPATSAPFELRRASPHPPLVA